MFFEKYTETYDFETYFSKNVFSQNNFRKIFFEIICFEKCFSKNIFEKYCFENCLPKNIFRRVFFSETYSYQLSSFCQPIRAKIWGHQPEALEDLPSLSQTVDVDKRYAKSSRRLAFERNKPSIPSRNAKKVGIKKLCSAYIDQILRLCAHRHVQQGTCTAIDEECDVRLNIANSEALRPTKEKSKLRCVLFKSCSTRRLRTL